ncbi:GGDEF domain-containing protein [Oscillospiraceae bacterium HV4-5-C5C]|nr:GGDEF domain-containing protein [Oscillospiraceae bacterium HV4-5-C5C]
MLYTTLVSALSILALLNLEYMIRTNDVMSKKTKYYFRLSTWAIILCTAAEVMTLYLDNGLAAYRSASIFFDMLGFAVSPFIPLLTGRAIRRQRPSHLTIFWIPPVINLLAAFLSAWFPILFYVSPANIYQRGQFFGVFVFAYISGMIYLLTESLQETIQYQIKNRPVLLFLFAFLLLGTTFQIADYNLRLSWVCVSFVMCLYYTNCSEMYHQIDGVTGLLNRSVYENWVRRMDGRKGIVIIYLDIDCFKQVNDRYGHLFGDRCLADIAAQISRHFARLGPCFRIGGDEFCVVCHNKDEGLISRACERFDQRIQQLRQTQEPDLPLVSWGYALYDGQKGQIEQAIARADRQMYACKASRRGAAGSTKA